MKANTRIVISKFIAAAFCTLLLLNAFHSFAFSLQATSTFKAGRDSNVKVFSSEENLGQIFQFCFEENDVSPEDECNCGSISTLPPYKLVDWRLSDELLQTDYQTYTYLSFFPVNVPIWLAVRSIRI